jgi:cell division protein FtsB
MAKTTKKRNPQDATLRNVRALKTRVAAQRDQVRELKRRVATLERRVRRLHEWQVLCKSPGFLHVIARIKMLEQAVGK